LELQKLVISELPLASDYEYDNGPDMEVYLTHNNFPLIRHDPASMSFSRRITDTLFTDNYTNVYYNINRRQSQQLSA